MILSLGPKDQMIHLPKAHTIQNWQKTGFLNSVIFQIEVATAEAVQWTLHSFI